MHKKLFAMLLAVMLAISLCSIAAFAEGDPDPPVYLNPKQVNTFNLPIRLKINQASSVNPETTLYFDCLEKLFYTDPDDENPLTALDMTFPDVTVARSITFDEETATIEGVVKNAVFTIPAISQVGIYEYTYSIVPDHQAVYMDYPVFTLRLSVFNGPEPDSKQMAVGVLVMSDEPTSFDPETGDPVWETFKVDELEIEYRAYEYSITKQVAGSLGDRDKLFDFTVRLTGAWHQDVWPGQPLHNEENGYPHVTISYSGGHSVSGGYSVSGSFKLEGGDGGEITTTSTVFNAGEENEHTVYTHSFEKTVTFQLKHGETVTFTNLPESSGLSADGTVITTTETDCSGDGYVTTIGGEERRTESYTIWCPEPLMDYESGEPVPVTDPETGEVVYQYGNGSVTVVNTKNGTIDTGIFDLDDLPYIIAVVVVVACGIAFFIIRKRRRSDDSYDDEA